MVGPVKRSPPGFFLFGFGVVTVFDRHHPKAVPGEGTTRGVSQGVYVVLAIVPGTSSWRGPRGPAASGFVTTVDQSDIRGLVTA